MGRVLCDWACHLCPHRKFVCLNDNIDHRKEGAELVSSLLYQNEDPASCSKEMLDCVRAWPREAYGSSL